MAERVDPLREDTMKRMGYPNMRDAACHFEEGVLTEIGLIGPGLYGGSWAVAVHVDCDPDRPTKGSSELDLRKTERAARALFERKRKQIFPRQEDVDLVVAHLRGNAGVLTGEELWAVYCEGDGYGRRSPEELAEINEGWDWSHVRDSSRAGWRRMASRIRMVLAARPPS